MPFSQAPPPGTKLWDLSDKTVMPKSPEDYDRSRSSSPSRLFGGLLASPEIRLSLAEEIIFLHPAPEGVTPMYDPMVIGSVTLSLPKPKRLKQLTVTLQGLQDIAFPNNEKPYESAVTLSREVSLLDGGEVELEKGEHTFEFSIIVPSSTGPYERSMHGRLRHTVVAKAEGIGARGGDISITKQVFFVVNPGGAGESEPPPPLDYKFEGHVDDLGPKAVQRAEARLGVTTEFKDLNLHSLATYALLHGQPVNSLLNGVLPLHAAATSGNEAIVRLLIEYGADVNSPRLPRKYSNDRGRNSSSAIGTAGSTPLHFAAANGHINIINLLLSFGAKASAVEKYGLTPDQIALQKNHQEAAEILRAWADDEADAASSTGSLHSTTKTKRMHPKRSLDTLALKLSHSASNTHLHFPHSNSSSSLTHLPLSAPSHATSFVRRASLNHHHNHLVGDGASHRRPSLPSVFEKASHPAAALKQALATSNLRKGHEPGALNRAESQASMASSMWSADGEGVERRRSLDNPSTRRRLSITSDYPVSAPPTKASFYPSELASSGSTTSTSSMQRSGSVSSFGPPTATAIANQFYRPRQSSQLSGRVHQPVSPLAGPGSPNVFSEEDDDDDGEEETPVGGTQASRLRNAHLRESSATSSGMSTTSSQHTSSQGGTTPDASDSTREQEERDEAGGRGNGQLATDPRLYPLRTRTDSVDSMSSGFSRRTGPQPLTKATPLQRSGSTDVGGRVETRSSRSNSASTDARFSSSPASSYSGLGTLSTYAPSTNSTVATSAAPSSPTAGGPQQPLSRQPLLAPLYETTPKIITTEKGTPITTSAQARHRINKVEQEILNYDPSLTSSDSTASRPSLSRQLAAYGQSLVLERKLKASEAGNGYQWETITKDGKHRATPVTVGEKKAAAAAGVAGITEHGAKASLPAATASQTTLKPTRQADDKTLTVPAWRAVPTGDRLMPPPSPNGRRSASPSSSSAGPSGTKYKEPTPPLPKENVTAPSSPRASSPTSTAGSGGISYVEVVPHSHSHSHAHSSTTPRAKGKGTKSDRTHSNKGGSVTSVQDQVLIDQYEQARIAASIPQAQLTVTPKKKGFFGKRLFKS
ncbi:Ankyrin repeat protein [Pseudohyphozyma bogoriensis]|nr:Ankyrin repeat protein [Pseudohyphozyma bogoriensis]